VSDKKYSYIAIEMSNINLLFYIPVNTDMSPNFFLADLRTKHKHKHSCCKDWETSSIPESAVFYGRHVVIM